MHETKSYTSPTTSISSPQSQATEPPSVVTSTSPTKFYVLVMDDKRRVDAAVAVTSQTDMEAEGAVVWRRKGPAGQAWKETKRMLRIGFTDRPSRYDFTHSFDPANPEGKK